MHGEVVRWQPTWHRLVIIMIWGWVNSESPFYRPDLMLLRSISTQTISSTDPHFSLATTGVAVTDGNGRKVLYSGGSTCMCNLPVGLFIDGTERGKADEKWKVVARDPESH